jgi:hypothetical protein
MKQPGLDDRRRGGTAKSARNDTLVGTLRDEYGADFLKGYRSDAKLGTVLARDGVESLSDLLKKR